MVHCVNRKIRKKLKFRILRILISVPFGKRCGDLFIEANFRYQAPAIQGIYKLSDTYALDADIRWNPTNRISVTASLDNILRRATPKVFKVTRSCVL